MTRLFWLFALLGTALFGAGCGTCASSPGRPFYIQADNFSFANELVWTYEFPKEGGVITRKSEPPPRFAHRCFPTVRAAREFFYHAEFAPDLPKLERARYEPLVGKVVRRNSRRPSPPEKRIVIPGYADLYSFSAENEAIIRRHAGNLLWSYFQRGNWRMVLPFTARGQSQTADHLVNELGEQRLPIVHIHSFPDLSLNHALLLYKVERHPWGLLFHAYDPNIPDRPAELRFDSDAGAFHFERNQYFRGGAVRVYEVYRGWLY